MYDLTRFTQSEATECGNALRALGSAASSMETAANNIVQHPYNNVIGDLARQTFNTFHIADAVDSPCITAQDDFVKPYGVKSVLGFGGVLSSGELFVVIMFSKVSIPASTASSFRDLSANVKEAVEPFVGGAVFA